MDRVKFAQAESKQRKVQCRSDNLTDFTEGQWWVVELDAFASSTAATADQKRAVAVVHNLLAALAASLPKKA